MVERTELRNPPLPMLSLSAIPNFNHGLMGRAMRFIKNVASPHFAKASVTYSFA